ncbi:hypothetical protein B0H19DRAFT_1081967 [Mycena capillaripes]|nr:hypothetical protein B0H19DRAFT_1081967 [Mycena capillaripes]
MAGPYNSGPYYSYGGNQAFFNSEYNYYQSNGYSDGSYARDYSGYNGYGGYGTNFSHPQHFPQPVIRQRTPTPPPPPAEPSPEYLAASLSAQPSSIPPGQRKLLIFDLNGTLLLRSPRNYGLRKIYLRPYARAMVAYIAHPAVRAWLDCMVWSSAQAHNVREMVDRVFGAGEGAGSGPILRAVWARDTLGLGREAFYQKTQTTKDLAKPWAFFATPRSPESEVYSPTIHGGGDGTTCCHPEPEYERSSLSSLRAWSSPPSSSPAPSSIKPIEPVPSDDPAQPPALAVDINIAPDSTPPPYPHGPHSTLLVDDSPLKARLQPWNHLCVGEYDAATRARDRAVARLPSDAHPSTSGDAAAQANGTAPRGKYRKELAAELAELAEESEAAAGGAGEPSALEANPVVREERWRKRKRAEEEAKAQADGADETPLVEDGSTEGASTNVNVALDSAPPVQVQGQSKRSQRRERKRLKKAGALEGGEQQVAGLDELASTSGSSDLSLSPSLVPTIVAEGQNSSNGVLQAEDSVIETNADAEISLPTSSPTMSPGGSKKRKRQPDAEEPEDFESGTKLDNTAAAPPCTDGEPYDPTLLAVVGVLAHVRSIGNIAAWVRSGGLAAIENGADDSKPTVGVPEAQINAKVEEEAARDGTVVGDGPPPPDAEPNLPSDPAQWFTSRRVLVAWAARGRTALAELGIDAAPGVE